MKTSEKTNGSKMLANTGDCISPMADQFGALYQAGFEDGFISGREAALSEARQAVTTQPAECAPPRPKVTVERFLLGLPCPGCGAYFASDEPRCPACKRPR